MNYLIKKIKESYLFYLFNKSNLEIDIFKTSIFISFFLKISSWPSQYIKIKNIPALFFQKPIKCLSILFFSAILINLSTNFFLYKINLRYLIIMQLLLCLNFLGLFIDIDYKTLTQNSWFYKKIFG